LPPLRVGAAWVDAVRASLPERPEARKMRLAATYGLSEYDADVIVRLPGGADFLEAMVRAGAAPKSAGNWLQGEVRRKLKDLGEEDMRAMPFGADALAELATLADRGVISSTVAKHVFETMWETGRRAQDIVAAEKLGQIADQSALETLVADAIARNPEPVAQYRAGRTNVLGFLVGQVMKASDGRANPKVVSDLMKRALDN
jgi:aspartyl-tRNA(Asn)/glutamyl-tRNA(Gln) amidotransferase subunit B